MLLADARRLRWCGIDMRPRWRRRVAVVATYAAYAQGISWCVAWHGYGWVTPVKAMWGWSIVVVLLGVFREGRLLKSFGDAPRGLVDRRGGRLGLRWAKFLTRSSARWKASPPEEQERWMRRIENSAPFVIADPRPEDEVPDERELGERNRAARRALYWLASLLGVMAYSAGRSAERSQVGWEPMDIAAGLMMFVVLALTLPKAIVLWRELDPREVSGELELVG